MNPLKNSQTVTIEKTGKRWKAAQLVSILFMVIGGVVCMIGAPDDVDDSTALLYFGAVIFFIGLASLLATKIAVWWYHG